ncbi:MFS transporter [Frigidibacter oleivorans]|uniref:MFS transporter n=1 Tax=Frigidibacter oleivorans TaxID=2487129 RepID=UPI000F8DF91A|nr:MFS transporter [Frigidibacter oleivorans]
MQTPSPAPLPAAFHRFVAASGLSNLGDGIATLVWTWAATLLTRDPLLIAAVPVALRMPWFLAAIPAGIVTDRTDRRHLILGMDAARAVLFALAGLALWAALPLAPPPDRGTSAPGLFALLMAAAGLVGLAEVFRDTAAQTMLPALVGRHRLEAANGRLWSAEFLGNAMIGPALGAMLVALWLPLPFLGNAAAYLAALALLIPLAGPFRASGPADGVARRRDWRAELREGLAFLRGAPLLRSLAWITGGWNLLWQMATVALLLRAQEVLHLSAPVYGLVLAGGAAGGIAGGFAGEAVARRFGASRSARWSLAACTLVFPGMALAPGPVSLALVLAAFEFTGIVWNTVSVAYRQRHIPDALLGRVNSLYRLVAWGMMPLGPALSGVILRLGDAVLPRETALALPLILATAGSAALTWAAWRPLGGDFGR